MILILIVMIYLNCGGDGWWMNVMCIDNDRDADQQFMNFDYCDT